MKRIYSVSILAGLHAAIATLLTISMVVNVSAEDANTEENDGEGVIDAGCVAEGLNIMSNAKIFIEFDATGCPVIVNPPDFYISKSKRVLWQAVDQNGNITPAVYEIFFEPFKGMKLRAESTDNGLITSRPIDWAAANAGIEFKYTVVGDNCKDKPLDPRFRLR